MSSDFTTEEAVSKPKIRHGKFFKKFLKIKRKILKHIWLVRGGIILGILGMLALLIFASVKFSERIGIGNYLVLASNFISAPTDRIASAGGRVNILIMGKAGGERATDSPDLTDTMILASVSLAKPSIAVISIPRDLWIPEIRAKINSAYFWGDKTTPYFDNSKNAGGKIAFAKAITSEVVGEPIQYGVVVDFSAFKDIIDALGGVQINVERSFTDNLYPVAGRENDTCGGDSTFACRYQTVTFNRGSEVMNGDTALKFVRSRHAEGIEGSDLAREARQQKVIDAIKEKLTNPKVLLSLKVDFAMLGILKKYVETDINGPTAAVIARKVVDGRNSISQFLIPDNLLFSPPINNVYDQQFVFIPKSGNGDWTDIHKWVQSILQ